MMTTAYTKRRRSDRLSSLHRNRRRGKCYSKKMSRRVYRVERKDINEVLPPLEMSVAAMTAARNEVCILVNSQIYDDPTNYWLGVCES